VPKHHTAEDVLAFFKKIDRPVPRRWDIRVVLAHTAAEVTTWLADPTRKRSGAPSGS
jgi:hypothetical protein